MVKARNIDEFTDAELAKMVRDSVYARGARFGSGSRDAQYLIVLAVPYGMLIRFTVYRTLLIHSLNCCKLAIGKSVHSKYTIKRKTAISALRATF